MRKELAWLRRGAPARTSKPKFRIDAANALIADVPPLRNTVELAKLATARLGKDVVDLLDVSVSLRRRPVLRDVEWRIGPGERTGILGANGAGQVDAARLDRGHGRTRRRPGQARQDRAVGDARPAAGVLADIGGDLVREVLGRLPHRLSASRASELTPAQLLERLGFAREHLSARVSELSGGQRRRLQLMLTLLSEPNVLILDEPTNDVDTDMLAAMEDLLDSWPGTLIVVSHDRYLLERVTDQQYAILGRAAAAPARRRRRVPAAGREQPVGAHHGGQDRIHLRAALYANRKELAAIERKLARIAEQIATLHAEIAAHDQSDYAGLGELTAKLRALESEHSDLEDRWLELSDDPA